MTVRDKEQIASLVARLSGRRSDGRRVVGAGLRRDAVVRLATLCPGSDEATEALKDAWQNDPDPRVRKEAGSGIARVVCRMMLG
jgi:HEAT repeat protein